MMSKVYDPHHWYWTRLDGRLYSSKERRYVESDNPAFLEFIKSGGWTTPFPCDNNGEESENNMRSVLAAYGIDMFKPAEEEIVQQGIIEFNGREFNVSTEARLNWIEMATYIDSLKFPLMMLDNNDTIFEIPDKKTLQDFLNHVTEHFVRNPDSPWVVGKTLRAQVEAATSMEEVDAVDLRLQ